MKDLETIEQHIIIRETIGYKGLEKVDVIDIPELLRFLKIVLNYSKMKKILDHL